MIFVFSFFSGQKPIFSSLCHFHSLPVIAPVLRLLINRNMKWVVFAILQAYLFIFVLCFTIFLSNVTNFAALFCSLIRIFRGSHSSPSRIPSTNWQLFLLLLPFSSCFFPFFLMSPQQQRECPNSESRISNEDDTGESNCSASIVENGYGNIANGGGGSSTAKMANIFYVPSSTETYILDEQQQQRRQQQQQQKLHWEQSVPSMGADGEDNREDDNGKQLKQQRRLYKADDNPPLPLTFLFGLQQVMVSVSVLVSIPFLISDEICPGRDRDQLRVRLIASTFVVCGIGTILQTGFGLRLALLQGVAFAYIPSVKAFMSLPEYKCNATVDDYVPPEVYEHKMAMIQGTLMASSCITMLIGATGLVGKMTKYIGPMTVSSLLMLLMLSSVKITVERIEKHWISLIMAASLFATVLYLSRLRVPFPAGYRNGKFRWVHFNLFGQFPYLTAISFSWALCFLLTHFELIAKDSVARTDKNATQLAIANAPYARFPFPGQFGAPRFNIGLFVGFLVSAQTTLFEAVGNYHAVARVSEERPPPSHAINRAIMSEGIGCFISGLIGPGVGITTHAENVGVIGITRVASRVTMLFGGCTLIAFGVVTKLGAILSAIPDPLVGVVLSTSMAMVGGVAVANVQTVDLRLSRNVAILGFSIMMGMIVPAYYERNPDVVATGFDTLDQVIRVLMNLPMFVGAATACFLDNTVGGATRQQRGLRERGTVWEEPAHRRDVYLYPAPVQRLLDAIPLIQYLPFVPKRKVTKGSNKKLQQFGTIEGGTNAKNGEVKNGI